MKVKLLAAAPAVATLLYAGVALATTNSLKGKVKGDANARVSLKVVVKKKHGRRRPTAVRGFKFAQVDYLCASGTTGEKSAKFRSVKVKLIRPRGHRLYSFEIDKTAGGVNYAVSGTVKKRGTKVKGSIEYTFVESGGSGEPDCSSGNVQFGARRKR